MVAQNIALYSWNIGVIIIAFFAVVCLALVGIIIKFVFVDGKEIDSSKKE